MDLKDIREKYGFTQERMSEELCCSRRMYQRYENGDFALPEAQRQLMELKIPSWESYTQNL